MPQNNRMASMREDEDRDRPVDAVDLIEQMLEAEIMGSGTYGADPDLDLIEERLSQLRQGSETAAQSADPMVEDLPPPLLEFELDLDTEPVGETVPNAGDEVFPDMEPVRSTASSLPPPPSAPETPAAIARPTVPPVVVTDGRSSGPVRPATSADAVVLEAARAAGVAPPYRQAATSAKPSPMPRTALRAPKRRASQPLSFYFAVVALLLASFAYFAVWQNAPADPGALPVELVGGVAEAVQAIPSLPMRTTTPDDTPVDPQITASVSDLSTTAASELAVAKPSQSHAARRVVKLYRVDAQGNIIGYTPTP